jgi:hypothetical protein
MREKFMLAHEHRMSGAVEDRGTFCTTAPIQFPKLL